MRISHRSLQEAYHDPGGWVRQQRGPSFIRTGYDGYTLLAIYRFHRHLDEADAARYLEEKLTRFNNPVRIQEALNNLMAYCQWISDNNPNVAWSRLRVALPLGSGVTMGGEVSRIDVEAQWTRYSAVLLGTPPEGWQVELRMPLLQRAVAQAILRSEDQVHVSYQRLDGTDLQSVHFSGDDIDEAQGIAQNLASTLSTL